MSPFRKDLFTKVFFAGQPLEDDDEYVPRMAIKNLWEPPHKKIPLAIKERFSDFWQQVKHGFQRSQNRNNLPYYMKEALRQIRNDETLVVVPCDKNLGPAVIERTRYIELAFRDHLNDSTTYERLHPTTAILRQASILEAVLAWVQKYKTILSAQERKFITTQTKTNKDSVAAFYLLMKVHKTPLKTRPITSVSGSILEPLGIWTDRILQKIAIRQRAYFKSSRDLKLQLERLPIPPGTRLFTADAVSMYTNINTEAALQEIGSYLDENRDDFTEIPIDALMQALSLIMRNNIFTFGDTIWLQLSGTAMGQPPAPPYANLFFAIHEERFLDEYRPNLLFYKRFIDDVFGAWIQPDDDDSQWEHFKTTMQSYHGMKWTFTERAEAAQFMDLTISIRDNLLHFVAYEKPQNLHLFLTPSSNHPPGVNKGLIFGQVFYYYSLCTDRADAETKIRELFHHLKSRAWQSRDLIPMFNQALERYDPSHHLTAREKPTPTPIDERIFFHIEYNPGDPSSSDIQNWWRDTISEPPNRLPLRMLTNYPLHPDRGDVPAYISLRQLTVAYHRAPNIGNLLSARTLSRGPLVSTVANLTLVLPSNRVSTVAGRVSTRNNDDLTTTWIQTQLPFHPRTTDP
jgi:hypothetical protein